jgi:proteasome lid subunit RPN8/RPN11
MTARIATAVLAAVLAEARADAAREVCGLLFGAEDHVTAHLPAPNVAADPARRFEVDPATLLAAHRAHRDGGPAILGCYHSHPTGSPDPSPRDAADAAADGWLWLIVGRKDARLWRAVPTGARHGRFDPVRFACVAGPAPPDSPAVLRECR